jgi:hypothetical protein
LGKSQRKLDGVWPSRSGLRLNSDQRVSFLGVSFYLAASHTRLFDIVVQFCSGELN